jgi:hypothetical protein
MRRKSRGTRKLCTLALCGLLVGAIGCVGFDGPVVAPVGALYTEYKVPQSTDFDATPAVPQRVGRANTSYLLIPMVFFTIDLAWGEASVKEAARNGGLSKVYYSDSEYTNVIGLYQKYTTIVYGE